MNWGAILKALPSLLSLVVSFIGGRKSPPKRAEEILGAANEPTEAEKARDEADKKADDKYNLN